ncbi:protein family UPF0592 [Hirsutella rhossiliensis]|uniref:Protein family UPF0592 n=1 Tax=Hirsutella rhossiliensis TaxID=111463 RepID=A0A9P8MLK2_9HYPO|nr:protein family UPF0592 [Hirsutella rhossiliensis]KAH0957488.1 protein family UPF0592 [Hirsutella rhossiliensis]
MASAVEQSAPLFSRSQSNPNIFSLSSFEKPTASPAASLHHEVLDWKSWADIPAFEVPSFNSDFELDTSVFANGKNPSPSPRPEPPPQELEVPDRVSRKSSVARSRTVSLINRPRSWLSSSSKSTKDAANDDRRSRPPSSADDNIPAPVAASLEPSESKSSDRGMPTPATFANFARWSWTTASRSPSPKTVPKPAPAKPPAKQTKAPPERLQLIMDPITESDSRQTKQANSADPTKPAKPINRSGLYFAKMKNKTPALAVRAHEGPDSDNSCASSSTSLGNRASNSDKTSASQSTCSDGNTDTPVTDLSTETTFPQHDPLWPSFKSLEADLKGFGIKPTAQRVGQIKNGLVPFLRNSMDHKSVKSLKLEDVDRRATVLNKWWVALLDMLYDRAQHPVPGVDRPILLEAATLLMMRPEWRQATTYFQPLSERCPAERVRSRSWTNASQSTDASHRSALLMESAEHNVRTMFVSNLVRQMGYVVEKMSVRHAPLSLVNFAGKTCAYAFFFAPGVADILVRLWGLTPELIRRTSDVFNLPRKDGGESDDIVALFPPKLGPLGWTSARAMWDMLKQIPKMSLFVARIGWTGPWVSRWKGRDTDLFFIFCKYFHVLLDQFIPPGLPVTEKARSPAFLLIHAQLLSIIDTTIHRQMALEHAYGPPLMDSANGADASAMAVPLPPTNLLRNMSENGSVILLRDFLADDAPEVVSARHTFAEAFACLIKGATCKTSQYNSAACFTLCDFLDEVIVIYHDFESRDARSSYIDWDFWLEVCKRIMSSLNTMSEVRMLSFLHTIWDAVAKDPRRKATFCLEWLLTEETFNSFFNNWCPMVRAYYQRLLCWRICRDDGNANEVDLNIMLVASARLKTVWSHYLYLKRSAEEAGRALPSTIPMSPAVGKKFMIVRQEVNSAPPGVFMGFDTFARSSANDALPAHCYPETQLLVKGDSKKRWSLLGKVLSMTTGSSTGQPMASEGPVRSPVAESDPFTARRGAMELSTRAMAPMLSNGAKPTFKTPAIEPDSLGRDLTRPKLPAPAQAQVAARARDRPVTPTAPVHRPKARRAEDAKLNGPSQTGRRTSVNASVEEWLRDTSMATIGLGNENWNMSNPTIGERRVNPGAGSRAGAQDHESARETLVKAVKPNGIFGKNSVYSGRALAEWAHVVAEYNSFVERRREEGVERLGEVEVPGLGVEGFRKIGG